jgi:hypothetical protein
MSMSKRWLEEIEALQGIAMGVLCDAKVLKECDMHSGTYLDASGDLQEAYKLANWRISHGEIALPEGTSRREFTDIIKDVYESNCADECYSCAKMFAE